MTSPYFLTKIVSPKLRDTLPTVNRSITVFLELSSEKTVRFSEQLMSADTDKYHRNMYFRAKLKLLFIYSVLRQGFSRTRTFVSNIKLFSGSLRIRPHACENE